MNRKDFTKKIFKLALIFDYEMTAEKEDIYWNIFKNYSEDQINKAFNLAITTYKFFPKPAELIEFIEGNTESKSIKAWQQVREAISKYGAYSSVVFADKVIHKIIDLIGGWQKICSINEDEIKWIQKEFERLYQLYQNQTIDYPDRLIGIVEEHNRNLGNGETFIDNNGNLKQVKDFIPKAILIGFEDKVLIEEKKIAIEADKK